MTEHESERMLVARVRAAHRADERWAAAVRRVANGRFAELAGAMLRVHDITAHDRLVGAVTSLEDLTRLSSFAGDGELTAELGKAASWGRSVLLLTISTRARERERRQAVDLAHTAKAQTRARGQRGRTRGLRK